MQPPKNKYFDLMIENTKDICEEHGVYIDFTGYDNLIEKLNNFKFDDFSASWNLSKECNAWVEYISDLKSLVESMLLDTETDKKAIISIASSKADSNKVANGERIANGDQSVVAIRKKRNKLQALLKLLDDKQQFLIQSHYFTRLSCEWAQKTKIEEMRNNR